LKKIKVFSVLKFDGFSWRFNLFST
jgi:hypothetical protein